MIKIQQCLIENLLFTIYDGKTSTEFYNGTLRGENGNWTWDISLREDDERLLFEYIGSIK